MNQLGQPPASGRKTPQHLIATAMRWRMGNNDRTGMDQGCQLLQGLRLMPARTRMEGNGEGTAYTNQIDTIDRDRVQVQ